MVLPVTVPELNCDFSLSIKELFQSADVKNQLINLVLGMLHGKSVRFDLPNARKSYKR